MSEQPMDRRTFVVSSVAATASLGATARAGDRRIGFAWR
jgi:hypothetical protein